MEPNEKQNDGKQVNRPEKDLGGTTLNVDSERHDSGDADFSAKEPNDDANHGTVIGEGDGNLDRGRKNALYQEPEKQRLTDNPDRKEDTLGIP